MTHVHLGSGGHMRTACQNVRCHNAWTERILCAPPAQSRRGVCFVKESAAPSGGAAAPSLAVAMPRSKQAPAGGARALGAGGPAGGGASGGGPAAAPMLDPSHPDAVLVNGAQWAGGEGRLPSGRPVVPVVVDPYLAVGGRRGGGVGCIVVAALCARHA